MVLLEARNPGLDREDLCVLVVQWVAAYTSILTLRCDNWLLHGSASASHFNIDIGE